MSLKPGRKPASNGADSPGYVWPEGWGEQRKLTEQEVAGALRAAHGNQLKAAERLGCTRDNVYKWVARTPALQKLMEELLEEEKDEHEYSLRVLAVEDRHPTAILAFLNAKARERGWSRAPEIQGSPMAAGDTHYHLHLHGSAVEKFANLSDSDLDRLIAERRAAIPPPDADDRPAVEIIPPAESKR